MAAVAEHMVDSEAVAATASQWCTLFDSVQLVYCAAALQQQSSQFQICIGVSKLMSILPASRSTLCQPESVSSLSQEIAASVWQACVS